MAESVSEKVVRLETQMIDTKKQLDRVEDKLDSLIIKLDDLTLVQQQIDHLEEQVKELKRRRVLYGWLFPTLAAVCGATLTILIEKAFQ